MKKKRLLLALVIIITFAGGFFVGAVSQNSKQTNSFSVNLNSESTKKTDIKEYPSRKLFQEKVLIGYIQDYRDPNTVPYDNLTHILFSFAHPTADGKLLFNGDIPLQNLRATVNKAHEDNTKVMLAIGGWYHIHGGESYSYFRDAISNTASRSKLVKEIQKVVQTENLDGIDIDFEHPRTKEDAQNLATFMKELNNILGEKELSIAVNAKVHSVAGTEINNVQYEASMFNDVDHVNIMAYDGQWDGEYNAANLSPFEFNKNIVSFWTTLFDTNKLPREKLILGIPSYAQAEDPNIKQVSYEAIIAQNPENSKKDTVKMNGTTYHYNGTLSVQKKTKLALDNGFGGMMMWEVGLDAKGDDSLTSVIANQLELDSLYTAK